MKLTELDPTLAPETILGRDDLVFVDVRRDPFRVYGLYDYKNEPRFIRIPKEIGDATNDGVKGLNYHTAGGRVRFATDSPVIAIRCKMNGQCYFPHMALSGTSGFDLYQHTDDGRDNYIATFMPTYEKKHGYESLQYTDGGMHTYTIHFPLYNDCVALEIGIQKDAEIDWGAEYLPIKPIVYYGSSITQGGCASRPGMAYQNVISALRNIDHINLGFSGSARGEDIIAEYMAGLDMSIFVMDYDHNAPTPEHLLATHEKLYRTIRAKHPDTPIIMVTKPDARVNEYEINRRNIVFETYRHAVAEGDKNVSFIDGFTFFDPEYHDICTVDGCHPNDAGFMGMARVIGREIDRILRKTNW
ncbi:MAG: SGNH/GDSL hydrolase family protein [Clostridia bacterium]|nr:SGNH/GDSL hydrolase family protein [Clostridia bacterium]